MSKSKMPTKADAPDKQILYAMISMPMGGKSKEEIDEVFEKTKANLEKMGLVVFDTRFHLDEDMMNVFRVKNRPLQYLAESLNMMSKCDLVYFVKGWEEARGCRVEHHAAKEYNLAMLYEEYHADED